MNLKKPQDFSYPEFPNEWNPNNIDRSFFKNNIKTMNSNSQFNIPKIFNIPNHKKELIKYKRLEIGLIEANFNGNKMLTEILITKLLSRSLGEIYVIINACDKIYREYNYLIGRYLIITEKLHSKNSTKYKEAQEIAESFYLNCTYLYKELLNKVPLNRKTTFKTSISEFIKTRDPEWYEWYTDKFEAQKHYRLGYLLKEWNK